jgi:hypothetical protein
MSFRTGDGGGLEPATGTGAGCAASDDHRVQLRYWGGRREFIANARNDTVWVKVKAAVVAKGGSVSFEVLRFLVIETAKSYLTAAACVTCLSTVVLDSLIIEAQTRR